LPATKALIDLLNRAQPIIEQAQSLYAEAEPLIDQAKKEWQTVGPAAQILIDVISHHVNQGSSPAEAAERRPLGRSSRARSSRGFFLFWPPQLAPRYRIADAQVETPKKVVSFP
jgi:hypothetical protein